MQRLFTMFPAGLPGVALVLLRIAVAIGTMLADRPAAIWLMVISGIVVLPLSFGALTPIVALLSVILQTIGWALAGGCPAMRLLVVLVTVALLLLGPGAYSMDARRFGRKRMTVEDTNHRSAE